MARKKSSPGEGFIDLVALLPWWVGVALAVVSYFVFHKLAQAPAGALQPGQAGAFVGRAMVTGVSHAAQYLVPLICVFGAILSFMRRRKRESLVNTVTQSATADALNGMSWREFEMLVGEAFRLQGYTVTESMAAGPDGGIDLVLRKGNEKFLVQCKQWKAFKVGVEIVRELYGVMTAEGAAGGFVVTSGTFTSDARDFAQGRNVTLLDGPKLLGMIQQARLAKIGPLGTPEPPKCPQCQAPMVWRTAKKGANAGSQFWGCSKYPACRGTR